MNYSLNNGLCETEHLTYGTPCDMINGCWSNRLHTMEFALSSIEMNNNNVVKIMEFDTTTFVFHETATLPHTFYPSSLQWSPRGSPDDKQFLASTSDCLRVWTIRSSENAPIDVEEPIILQFSKDDYGSTAMLSSVDWSRYHQNRLATTSPDGTCTIWDLNSPTEPFHLFIAHDKEVYDVCWGPNPYNLATVGLDGSLRLFDVRDLSNCNIIHQTQQDYPLARAVWNHTNEYYIAVMGLNSNQISIVDTRHQAKACLQFLHGSKTSRLCSLGWTEAPSASTVPQEKGATKVYTAGMDGRVFSWDFHVSDFTAFPPKSVVKHISPINYATFHPEYNAILYGTKNQVHLTINPQKSKRKH